MTIEADIKKRIEQHFVEEAARLLGESWSPTARERPDFMIGTGGSHFGLEVSQVYLGASDERGSCAKMNESRNDRWLNEIRREIEQRDNVVLDLTFLGERSDAARAAALAALSAEDFANRPVGHRMEPPPDDDESDSEFDHGRLWATKAIHPRATFVKDSSGWVSADTAILQKAISRKAPKLADYREATKDVRLLLVADRTRNSGKLMAISNIAVDPCGFDVIYFLSYPVKIVICEAVSSRHTSK